MRKALQLFALTWLLSISISSAAYAGNWKQNDNGWWWQDADKSYPVSSWEWIDSDRDGTAQCYYFDENGYLLTDTVTPEGYTVDENGAWIEDGIIRQRAANPSAANTMNQKGLELYESADLKSSELPGLDVNADVLMNVSYWGFELPISINSRMKYHDINTPSMEFLYNYRVKSMGISSAQTAFYTDGCYYFDGDKDGKYKMKIGYNDMSSHMTFGGLTGQFGAFLENVQAADDSSGNKILFYSSSTDGLEKYLDSIYGEIWPELSYYDMKLNQVNGKAVISPEGYFSREEIFISAEISDGYDSMDMSTLISLDYNHPGQTVSVNFPSKDGFEEVVY